MGSPPPEEHSRFVTRRRALGTLAAGLGALVVGDPRTTLPTVEIPTVAGRGEVLETATVPAVWHEQERRARAVLASVREHYADVAGVLGASLAPAGEPVADRPTSSVDLHVDPAGDVDSGLPSAVDGVRTRLVEAAEPDPLSAPAGSARESIGGAATVRTAAGATASATCEVTWRGDSYLMTCAHLFKGSDGRCDDLRGLGVYSASGERIGRVALADAAQDWALVEGRSADAGFAPTIAGARGSLCGRVTAIGLQYLMCRRAEVCKKGQATPERRGSIRAIGVRHGGCDLGDGRSGQHYVDVDVPARPGDSGGPVFHRFEFNGRRYLALVGAVSASVEYTRATAAYAIHDGHGVGFSPAFRAPA